MTASGVGELQERVRRWKKRGEGEPIWEAEPPWDFLNFTQIPDRLFDRYLAYLSGAEVKVFLYLARHTWGWKKPADAISLNQMLRGIVRRDGSRQDHGVGLSRSGVVAALASLEAKHLIVRKRRTSPERGHEATVYAPRMSGGPLVR